MKLKNILSVFALVMVSTFSAMAQGERVPYFLGADINGTTINIPAIGLQLYDEEVGESGLYEAGIDYYVTLKSTCDSPYYLCLKIGAFDIYPSDTVFFYDGPDTNSRLIVKANSYYNNLAGLSVYAGPDNTSKSITVRFKTHALSQCDFGFGLDTYCQEPCETFTPEISMKMNKYLSLDDEYPYTTVPITLYHDIDTAGDTTGVFYLAPVCIGDYVTFEGHATYTHLTGHYNPTDSTSYYNWNMGDGTIYTGQGMIFTPRHSYQTLDCYTVKLTMEDVRHCPTTMYPDVMVRVAQNPIKTIYDLNTICNNDSLLINVGYTGDNSTLTLKTIEFSKVVSKTYDAKTFIPDGQRCETPCYHSVVNFSEFPAGRNIQSANDICSICVNYEHSYMGDYRLAIICPTGQKAYLKWGNRPSMNNPDPECPSDAPEGSCCGGYQLTGIPAGGSNDGWGDGSATCDSLANNFGYGFDYCFSLNPDYTYTSGNIAGTLPLMPEDYIGSTGNMTPFGTGNEISDTLVPAIVPPYFTNHPGEEVPVGTGDTKIPSDHLNKLNYYAPASDFSELIGCPLNGDWNIEVCDFWGSDNGWVFAWSMDICNVSAGNECEYQVGLDSVTWRPDSTRGDWLTGKYRGLIIDQTDSVNAYVKSPDTAGNFGVVVTVYDEFKCVWDTMVGITTVWTPNPDLGPDTTLCSVDYTVLDASDAHTAMQNYTYAWEPTGQETDTIHTQTFTGGSVTYVVEATNRQDGKRCTGRDTIVVDTKIQPIPSFDPGIYPLEGCEPYVFSIDNTSIDGSNYQWIFGDGDTSDLRSPTHTYLAGTYDVKYYVTSSDGCIDSLIYPQLITVFPNPVAKFSWSPVYPSVTDPVVTMENRTTPDRESNEYFWEFQYDVTNPYSFETLIDKDPTFEWLPTDTEGDLSGSYIVRLIARTSNIGPSGNVTQCIDTVENSILMVNDFLQFPNAVTPNGDGVNDRFEIVNLVNGFGYPINRLEIFNKWGSRVFLAEDIDNESEFWDPNETHSPDGTYYFHFVGKGYNGTIERNGVIEVIR